MGVRWVSVLLSGARGPGMGGGVEVAAGVGAAGSTRSASLWGGGGLAVPAAGTDVV